MDMLIWLGAIFLAALTHASLQLDLGTFLLLYHHTFKRLVHKKAKTLASSFIAGVGLLIFFGLCATCYVITLFAGGSFDSHTLGILTIIMLVLAFIIWLCYYRRDPSTTALWIPKPVAKYIADRAKVTASDTEAFALGCLTCLVELPFNLILFTLAADSTLALPQAWQLLAVAIYTLIAILPLLIMRIVLRRHRTVIEVQRWRVKNKSFLRFLTGFGFLVLAAFVFAFKVLGC